MWIDKSIFLVILISLLAINQFVREFKVKLECFKIYIIIVMPYIQFHFNHFTYKPQCMYSFIMYIHSICVYALMRWKSTAMKSTGITTIWLNSSEKIWPVVCAILLWTFLVFELYRQAIKCLAHLCLFWCLFFIFCLYPHSLFIPLFME